MAAAPENTNAEIRQDESTGQANFDKNSVKMYEHAHPGHEDDASSIRSEALGDNLPPGYFTSFRFICAVAVST